MSYGPTRACVKCKAPLDLKDPRNGGYCGGHMCKLDPLYQAASPVSLQSGTPYARPRPKFTGTRKQRRAAEAKARKQKHGARR